MVELEAYNTFRCEKNVYRVHPSKINNQKPVT